MRKDVQPGSEEFTTFTDIFKIYKEIGEPEITDAYWSDAVQRVEHFTTVHDTRLGHSLAHALLEALLDTPDKSKYSRWLTIIAAEAVKNDEIADAFLRQALNILNLRRGGKT